MKRSPAKSRGAAVGFTCAILWLGALGIVTADGQTAVPTERPATLSAVDFNFVGQANLGAPFQVELPAGWRKQKRRPQPSAVTRI